MHGLWPRRPSDAYDCVVVRAQTGPRHAKGPGLVAQTDFLAIEAAKGCRRGHNTHGSLGYCCSLHQSKSRLVVVILFLFLHQYHHHHEFTPAASPSPGNLSSPATLTTTDTSHLLFHPPALYAIPIACTLSDYSPLFLSPPSPFSLHSLIQRRQSYHSLTRNDG